MEIYGRQRLDQKMTLVKEDPVQRQLLRIILKYEMQTLLQRLAELGEEGVVVMASLSDGCHSVLASDQCENFLHNQVVSLFKDHFVNYLNTGIVDSDCKSQVGKSEMDEEPETFMHMKKHQIEQYNRRWDKKDKSIDETVSMLVRNILKEGKEKERMNKGYTSYIQARSPGVGRRKRHSICHDGTDNSFRTNDCSAPKRKTISSFFPDLSQESNGVKDVCSIPVTSPFAPALDESSSHSMSIPENNVVTIKLEPVDNDEYGDVTSASIPCAQINDSAKNDHSHRESAKNCHSISDSCHVNEKASQPVCSDSEKIGSSDKVKGTQSDEVAEANLDGDIDVCKDDKDGDIELPYVEEFYQGNTAWDEDVKLLYTETSPASLPRMLRDQQSEKKSHSYPIAGMRCYKQSKKKSNTFNLILDGYSYIKDKEGKAGTLYWKCGRGGCKGRVIQRGEELIISQTHIHNPAET